MNFFRPIFLIIFLVIAGVPVHADDFMTQVSPRRWTQPQDGRRYSISQVGVSDLLTFIFIEVEAMKKQKNVNLYADPATSKVFAGDKELPLLGILDPRGNVHKFTSTYDWVWNEMPKNSKSEYCLVFSGRPNPGETTITVRLNGIGSKSYTFGNIQINNPSNSAQLWNPGALENTIKQIHNNTHDDLQGIYRYGDLKLGLFKAADNDWRIVYISGGSRSKWWSPADAFAQFTSRNGSSLTNGTYVWANKETTNCTAQIDGDNLRIFYNHTDMLLMREYPAPTRTYIDPTKPPKGDVWTGTGWSLLDNYIVTNLHVIRGARTISIKGINGNSNTSYNADVVATDEINDLAILKVKGISITNIPYAVSTQPVEVGQEVFVLGYPMTDTMGEEIKLTNGIVSALTGFQGAQNNYQISAPIQPGNSGGPMFDSNGNVIGIVVSKHTEATLAGYAIKISLLDNLMRRTIGRTVFPTQNRISSLPLTDKIKMARRYVYYIMCSDTPDAKL